MKNKHILSVCIGCLLISDIFAKDLKEELLNLEIKIAKLSKSLSLDDIQKILKEVGSLRKKQNLVTYPEKKKRKF